MARRLVGDHAVGGIDGLIDQDSGQAEHQRPERRRHDAIGEVLGERFQGSAADARFVQTLRIATDNLRHRGPGVCQAASLQRARHIGDMRIQAPLCQEQREDGSLDDPAEAKLGQAALDREANRGACQNEDEADDRARLPARRLSPILAVPPAVEPGDHPADQRHGMKYAAINNGRIAERGIDDKAKKQSFGRCEHGSQSGPGFGPASMQSPSRSKQSQWG